MSDLTNFFDEEKPVVVQNLNIAIQEPDNPHSRVDGQWYYSKDRRNACYRYDAKVEAWLQRRNEWMELSYICACYIYYHCTQNIAGIGFVESPWSDEEFDRVQASLDLNREYWSPWFAAKIGNVKKGFMKSEAFMIEFTPKEKEYAVYWAKNYASENRKMLGYQDGLSSGLSSEKLQESEEAGTIPKV